MNGPFGSGTRSEPVAAGGFAGEFISLLGGAAVAASAPSRAQQPSRPFSSAGPQRRRR
jgi:hypothetical protein